MKFEKENRHALFSTASTTAVCLEVLTFFCSNRRPDLKTLQKIQQLTRELTVAQQEASGLKEELEKAKEEVGSLSIVSCA